MEFIYFSYQPQSSSNSAMNKKDSKLSKNYFTIYCSIKKSSIIYFSFSTFN